MSGASNETLTLEPSDVFVLGVEGAVSTEVDSVLCHCDEAMAIVGFVDGTAWGAGSTYIHEVAVCLVLPLQCRQQVERNDAIRQRVLQARANHFFHIKNMSELAVTCI